MARTRVVARRSANINFQRGNFSRDKEIKEQKNNGNFKINSCSVDLKM